LGSIPVSFEFSEEERLRYSRNLILPEVGWGGQERFRSGKVLVVGAGGIGSAALLYLAAAGVGHIGIVDDDVVELSNLQRQILHQVADLGRPKVESAREAITAVNPHCRVEIYDIRLKATNNHKILREYEAVLDASDNFETRFLVADSCWLEKIPLVSAAANGFQGLLLVVDSGQGSPCYRCLIPEPPPTLRQEGILGAVAGVMGCLQAIEALKLLLGRDSDLARCFLSYDALRCRFISKTRIQTPACPLCGENPTITGLAHHAGAKEMLGGGFSRETARGLDGEKDGE
jgi:molybdopterin/thiamine biosynthesis adenylyltransferase